MEVKRTHVYISGNDLEKAKEICNDRRHGIPALEMRRKPWECKQCNKIAEALKEVRQQEQSKSQALKKVAQQMAEALRRNVKEWNEFHHLDQGHVCQSRVRLEATASRSNEALTAYNELMKGESDAH